MNPDLPVLWFLTRSTGFVILALFTLSTLLGVLSSGSKAGKKVPSFVTQSVHRNVSLLSVVLLAVHVYGAVAHEFIDVRWWQAFVPWYGAQWQPLWLGFGTLALDLFVVITLTSLVRDRLPHGLWRVIHLTAYLGWVASLGHALGTGTDIKAGAGWAYAIVGGSIGVVLIAAVVRFVQLKRGVALAEVAS